MKRTALAVALALSLSACGGGGADRPAPALQEPQLSDPSDAAVPAEGAEAVDDASAIEPLTEREPGCLATVDALPFPPPEVSTGDPLARLAAGDIPPLPVPGHEDAAVAGQITAKDIDSFFAQYPNVIAPEERRRALESAGLIASVETSFVDQADRYGVQMVQFRTSEGALEYYRTHLRRICRDAINLHPLDSPSGAVAYTRELDGLLYPRAVALVGDVEIAVTICRCSGVEDLEGLSAEWVQSLAAFVRTGH